jgi:hypothetical protein
VVEEGAAELLARVAHHPAADPLTRALAGRVLALPDGPAAAESLGRGEAASFDEVVEEVLGRLLDGE